MLKFIDDVMSINLLDVIKVWESIFTFAFALLYSFKSSNSFAKNVYKLDLISIKAFVQNSDKLIKTTQYHLVNIYFSFNN